MRAGIHSELLRHDLVTLVGEAEAGEEALRLIGEVQPEVALLDCRLPGSLDGVAVAQVVRDAGWATRVIALSVYEDGGWLYGMWRAGAAGYLLKDEALEVIAQAVARVARGEQLWNAEQVSLARRWWEKIGSTMATLTGREREILTLVATDHSNREIAQHLEISERTVETHVRNLMVKTKARSRLGLATFRQLAGSSR